MTDNKTPSNANDRSEQAKPEQVKPEGGPEERPHESIEQVPLSRFGAP